MALTTSAANRARSFSVAPPKASFRPLVASQKNWSIKYPWALWISTRSNPSRRAASPARPKARIVSAMSFSLMAIPRGSFGALRPDGLSIGPGGSHLASGTTTAPPVQICGPIAPPAACTSSMTRPQPASAASPGHRERRATRRDAHPLRPERRRRSFGSFGHRRSRRALPRQQADAAVPERPAIEPIRVQRKHLLLLVLWGRMLGKESLHIQHVPAGPFDGLRSSGSALFLWPAMTKRGCRASTLSSAASQASIPPWPPSRRYW